MNSPTDAELLAIVQAIFAYDRATDEGLGYDDYEAIVAKHVPDAETAYALLLFLGRVKEWAAQGPEYLYEETIHKLADNLLIVVIHYATDFDADALQQAFERIPKWYG